MHLRCGDRVVAPLEIARTARARTRGLLGRDGMTGAILLAPASAVHTIGMRFAIDVAFCDGDLTVLRTVTMRPNRLGRPVLRSRAVVEAEAGGFTTWGIARGARLTVVDDAGSDVPWRSAR